MSSTYTAPIRIFKRNNPSNDGTIAPDNTGAAECTVQAALVGGVPAVVVVPAGSIISNVKAYLTTGAGTPGTPNVTVASTVVGTLSDAAGINAVTFGSGSAAVGILANVGTVDVPVSFTPESGAVGTLSVTYTPRNIDGTITAYGSGYTNS